jgi:hypothetical protein
MSQNDFECFASTGVNTPVFTKTTQRGGTVEQGPHGKLRSAKRLRLLTPGSEKSRSLRTRGTLIVEICTGGKVMLHFALAGSGALVQTNGLRFQARQRYASKVTDLFLKSQPEKHFVYVHLFRLAHRIGNCLRERVGRNCNLLVELLDALATSGSVILFGSSVATAPGEITVVRML